MYTSVSLSRVWVGGGHRALHTVCGERAVPAEDVTSLAPLGQSLCGESWAPAFGSLPGDPSSVCRAWSDTEKLPLM